MKYHIRVIPWAKKLEISNMWKDMFWLDVLKVKLTAKPVDWEANSQLIDVLSKYFECHKRDVNIISWHTWRDKILEISK